MPRRKRHPLVTAVLTILLMPMAASAQEPAPLAPADLVSALRQGGNVVYIRHARTEADYADQVTADPGDCATQRVLSREGWAQAKGIGANMRRLDIPVGQVLSSEYCRAWQTADLAFGQTEETAALNFEPAEEYTDAQFTAMRDRVLPLVLSPVEGGNRIIVGHDDPFEAVTGIYPEPQGVAYVLRVTGGNVEVLGSIPPEAWADF